MSLGKKNVLRKPVSAWLTEHRRYFEYLDIALVELRRLDIVIQEAWPDDSMASIEVSKLDPAVHQLCRHRDLLGDAIPVFAAMSIESFLNLWGVQRMGEREFIDKLEKNSAVKKFIALAAMEGVEVKSEDEVVDLVRRIMKRRHDLVHPKAREVPVSTDPVEWPHVPLVESVPAHVRDCKAFFDKVRVLLPSTKHLLPNDPAA